MNVWSLLSPQEQSHINNVYKEEKLLEEILDYKGKDIINDTVYPDDYQTFFNKAVNIKSVKYRNGIQQLISADEIYTLIDRLVTVPHTRYIKVSEYRNCVWKYKVHVQRIKNI